MVPSSLFILAVAMVVTGGTLVDQLDVAPGAPLVMEAGTKVLVILAAKILLEDKELPHEVVGKSAPATTAAAGATPLLIGGGGDPG